MQYDKQKIKESLTSEQVKKILTSIGSKEPLVNNRDTLVFSTVCHGGHKHKLYYYHDSKSFHCYTDCSENMDIFEVVVRGKKQQGYEYSFPQAVKYVAELTGKTFGFSAAIERESEMIDDWDWLNRFNKEEKVNTKLPVYDEKVLDVFLPYPHEEWLNEGISYGTMKKFNVSYYLREDRIVLPHFSLQHELIGIRGRAMRQEDIDSGRKYMPVTVANQTYNHPTMLNLFGLHKTKEAIKRLKKVAIFEGEKSVLKCEDYYGEDNFSCATCSSTITNFHRDILLSLGVEEVIICYDRLKKDSTEAQIEDYQKKLLKLANKFTPYVRTYIVYDDFELLDSKDSPVDKGKEVLEELMKCKYEIKTNSEGSDN